MSYERKEGKDTIIFLSKKDSNEPGKVTLEYDKDDEEHMGLIRPDGEINWNCPCLQGMADGPCGPEFKESFSCFHYSEADPKGSDCIDQFRSMQECFMKYPEVYAFDDDKDDSGGDSTNNSNQDEKPSNDSKDSAENNEVKIDKAQAEKDDSPSINENSTDDKNDKSG